MNKLDQVNEIMECIGEPKPEITIVVETPHVALVCITALVITFLIMGCVAIAWDQFIDEWRKDRAASVVVAQYQLVTAQIQADTFNTSPIPGQLQCVRPDPQMVHADMVVNR